MLFPGSLPPGRCRVRSPPTSRSSPAMRESPRRIPIVLLLAAAVVTFATLGSCGRGPRPAAPAGIAGPSAGSVLLLPTVPVTDGASLKLDLGASSVVAGGTCQATVTLAAALANGAGQIALSSSDPAASVPAKVILHPGSTVATFTVTTNPVSATTSVAITATLGTAIGTATLSVTPAPVPPPPPPAALASVSVSPTSMTGGGSAQGTVTLAAAAPTGGVVVGLASSSAA